MRTNTPVWKEIQSSQRDQDKKVNQMESLARDYTNLNVALINICMRPASER